MTCFQILSRHLHPETERSHEEDSSIRTGDLSKGLRFKGGYFEVTDKVNVTSGKDTYKN